MRVILFGGTGMIGTGVLRECLRDQRVHQLVTVGRAPSGSVDARVRDLVRSDFFHYEDAREALTGFDACFFCIGVTSAGKSEATYRRLTFDLTLAAATALADWNPGMTFCYVSGQGTDSTERGRVMWARVKGQTENALLRLPLKAYMFRPGFIQPLAGIRSKTRLYQAVYAVTAPIFPLLRRLAPNQVSTTEVVGRAMIRVAIDGYPRSILEVRDINAIGSAG